MDGVPDSFVDTIVYVDSGLAAAILGQDDESLRRHDGPLGGLLEGFVLSELARQLTWSDQRAELFHYRTKDQVEVDAVIENRRGQVVAIEVKASTTVRGNGFAGLRRLASRLGPDLAVLSPRSRLAHALSVPRGAEPTSRRGVEWASPGIPRKLGCSGPGADASLDP